MSDLAALGIGANPHGRAEQRVPCPHCDRGGRDDALGVNVEDGRFHCFRCGWKGRAGGEVGAPRPITRIDDPAVAERKRERLRRVWHESVALTDPAAYPIRRYLAARGLEEVLKAPPTALRAHPGIAYWDGRHELGVYPAMLALLMDRQGTGVTVHATYLRPDGTTKASVPAPRKLLGVPVPGSTRGGAIRIHEGRDGLLGVAEGIESALSLHLIERIPVWAAFCANNLAAIHLPRNLKRLYIGVDLDESGKGQAVANALASRVSKWRGAPRVFMVTPDGAAPRDLNDDLLARRAG